MSGAEFYGYFKDALAHIGVGWRGMGDAEVFIDGDELVIRFCAISSRIKLPKLRDNGR